MPTKHTKQTKIRKSLLVLLFFSVFSVFRGQVFFNFLFPKIENGKTKSASRKVWLSDKALDVLQVRVHNCKDEYLFPKNKNSDQPIYQLDKAHVQTVNRIGLKFRLYDCRHTFATRILDNGIDLLTLASMLGHSSLSQVMRYAHPSETRKNEAIQQMQRKVAKAV